MNSDLKLDIDSQSRVGQMKSNLKKCKEELLQKRTDLLNLWYKSQQYKEMLSILETMYVENHFY